MKNDSGTSSPGRRRRRSDDLLAALALIMLLPAGAAAALEDLEKRVVEETLTNGMRVIVLPRPQSPTVSLFMQFRAGSAQEEAGRSGVAHLLEHMMFKGTRTLGTRDFAAERPLLARIDGLAGDLDAERRKGEKADPAKVRELAARLRAEEEAARRYVVKDEIDSIYTVNGAQDFNASTGVDLTTYKISLPSNRLPLWARIESERLRDPVLREFYSEREVVREERRQSYESNPARKLMELFLASAFLAHPYRRPVIGWDDDVAFLRVADAERFHRTWYAPNNTVLAAVGDVDPAAFLRLVREAFGTLPAQPAPADLATAEPPQRGERRVTLTMDASPQVLIGFHKPALPAFEDYVFDIIDGVLSEGRTSRLYRSLVEEQQVAVAVGTVNGLPGSRYPNLFTISATPRAPHTAAEVEAAIDAELARLASEPPAVAEIEKVKHKLRADLMRGLQSNEGMANMLSHYEAVAGDWRYITTHLDRLNQITPEDVRAVAAGLLQRENRTVATLVKKEDGRAP